MIGQAGSCRDVHHPATARRRYAAIKEIEFSRRASRCPKQNARQYAPNRIVKRPDTASVMPSIYRYTSTQQPFKLIHADHTLLVVNKPTNLLSVPGRGADKQDCLVARVQTNYPDALIVHRLDCDTSGLLVLARNKDTHRRLSIQFQDRQVDKRYVAVVKGKFEQTAGEIALPLIVDWPNRPLHKVDFEIGKPSLTLYRVLAHDELENTSRVELTPETGRTHQLRVHMLALGHPILGDSLYADPETRAKADRLLLHAEFLSFDHPISGERLNFSCSADF